MLKHWVLIEYKLIVNVKPPHNSKFNIEVKLFHVENRHFLVPTKEIGITWLISYNWPLLISEEENKSISKYQVFYSWQLYNICTKCIIPEIV